MTVQEAYFEGFCKVAETNNVDPAKLMKLGNWFTATAKTGWNALKRTGNLVAGGNTKNLTSAYKSSVKNLQSMRHIAASPRAAVSQSVRDATKSMLPGARNAVRNNANALKRESLKVFGARAGVGAAALGLGVGGYAMTNRGQGQNQMPQQQSGYAPYFDNPMYAGAYGSPYRLAGTAYRTAFGG